MSYDLCNSLSIKDLRRWGPPRRRKSLSINELRMVMLCHSHAILSSIKQKMLRSFFCEKHQKDLATGPASVLLCCRAERFTTMILPFPADSAEFEEYTAAMEEMADLAEASTPDPEPEDLGQDDSHLDGDWEDYSDDEGGEDRYLDSYWEDQSEYGMEGCCGDF